MIQNRPQYRIKYPQCTQPNHNGEKLNFVCLQKHCRQSALICTLCRQSLHQGHSIKPLKFYFEDLRKQYQSNEIDYPSQLAQLEKNKNIFLYQLRETVERIAKQFEKLQIEILQRFDMIRNQILENQSRKNQFPTFYQNLTHKAEEDPQILMKNYLPHQEIQEIRNTKIVTKLADMLCSQLIKTRESLFLNSPKEQFGFLKKLSDQQLYIKPANILKEGYVFTQTDINANPPSLVLLNIPVKQLIQQKSSIKIKVLQLRKGSKLTLGLISKKMFSDLKFIWNNPKQNETMWIFNNGGTHAVQSSSLAVINEGLNIDLTMVTQQQFKISSKKAAAIFKLNKNHQWYFFFSLIGKAKLEVSF